jgi:NosR/NirI family transcriptional regulator, nitrous oxide reductase regulator
VTQPAGRGVRALFTDVGELAPVRLLVGLRAFQFLLVLPTTALVGVVLCSAAVGVEHPSFNFGATFTWVVWWGTLLGSFVVLGRAWCLVCPIGAVGEWVQRLSFWRRVPYTAGYHLRWPRPLRNLGLATGLFIVFVWLDNGYGMSNSPRMTAGLIVVLVLGAAWVNLFFERRAFCRYVCPLTAFIGLCSLFSMFELRSRDPSLCRSACPTKDCFRGNARQYGCPMDEFPAVMDTNLYCILCTECLKGCAHDNLAMRFRPPGRDLWTMRHPETGGALAAAVVVGLATFLPLLLLVLLPDLRRALAAVMPGGGAPNDGPRLAAVGLLFALGIAAGAGVIWGFSALARQAAREADVSTRAVFTRVAFALVPIALFKMMADLLDHALRTWGALLDVTHAMALDFPLNRVVPGRVTVVPVPEPGAVYALQAALILCGLAASLYALHRISGRLYAEREAALQAFLPLAGLALVLALMGLWTLGIGLL